MKKTVKKTVTTVCRCVSVPIPGADDFVLVHIRNGTLETNIVMEKSAYENATSPDHLKPATFQNEFTKGNNAKWHLVTQDFIKAVRAGDTERTTLNKFDAPTLKYGELVPEDCALIGIYYDQIYFELDGSLINQPIRDTYLNRYYDIKKLYENEQDNPAVIVLKPHSWSRPIYYVHGNGDTIALGLWLTDEQYQEYLKKDYYEKSVYLREVSILKKYKREEELNDD